MEFGTTVRNRSGEIRRAQFQETVRPASLLWKSILDMGPAGICDSWLQCNIQVACQLESVKMLQYFN